METSPLLARRVIPLTERLQKASAVLLLAVAITGGTAYLTSASPDSDRRLLAALAAMALLGVCLALYFALKKNETARSKEAAQAIRMRIDDDRRGASWVRRIGYGTRRFIFGIVIFSGLIVTVAGIGLFGMQVFQYLRTGAWHSLSVLTVLYPYVPWLRDPQSWLGLYKVTSQLLALLPVSLVLVVCGWMIAGLGSGLRGKVKRKGP